MSSYVQLLCLLISFIYGFILYKLNYFNYKILKNKFIIFRIILYLLYILDLSILYIVILYKINKGILHIYFVIMIILGFIISSVKKRK